MFSPHISHASTKYVRNVTVDKCFVTELFKWLWLDLRFLLLVKEILGLLNHNSRKINLWLLHLFLFRTKTAIPVRSVQNADCWLQIGYKMQTGHKMQTADCRLGKKMQTENLFCFFVWYLIICHPTTYRASRNRAFPRSSFTIICTIVRLPALVWNIPCPFLDHNRS